MSEIPLTYSDIQCGECFVNVGPWAVTTDTLLDYLAAQEWASETHSDDLMEDAAGFSMVVHGKGGRTRIVPLARSLGSQIAQSPKGFLFPGRDHGHLSPRYVGRVIRDLLPGEWTMHTLRHRFATRAYALTTDLLLVQEILGHASPSTTRRYVRTDPTRARAAVERLAERMEDVLTAPMRHAEIGC